MHSPFVDSDSHLPGDHERDKLLDSQWGRVLMVAIVLAVAAGSAVLLMN
jgi:hypothetical protein